MLINLKKGVNPFKIHNGKEWQVIQDGTEIDSNTYKQIKNKVVKLKEGEK
jgi:hypothetical protein